MTTFKKGDLVERFREHTPFNKYYEAPVPFIIGAPNRFGNFNDPFGEGHSPRNLRLVWQPVPGGMIEIRDTLTGKWYPEGREFIGMDGDLFVVKNNGRGYFSYLQARPIKKQIVLTNEETGQRYVLSEETAAQFEEESK